MRLNNKVLNFVLFSFLLLAGQNLMADERENFSVNYLMQLLEQTADPSVHYTEEKNSDLLDINLKSKGILSLDGSGVMEKTVIGSVATSKMRVTETELQIIRQGKERKVISLQRYPVIKAFLAAFKATLQGDLDELQRYYNIELSGSLTSWQLALTPQTDTLQKAVESIQIFGSEGHTLKYIVKERRGDTSTLLIGEELL